MNSPGVSASAALIAIGNFDGVHRGHRHLLERVLDEARELELVPTALTFHPHPSEVLGRTTHPVLTRLEHKLRYLREVSPELRVVVHPFDLALAGMNPEDFVREVLLGTHHARRVIVGNDFRFGRDRTGTLSSLIELGATLGFSAAAVPLLAEAGEAISSSRIRQLLRDAELREANALLGREHELWGTVVTGQHRGRTIGFPTANLDGVQELLPKNGVYACRIDVPARSLTRLPAICNIGTRPTVGGGPLSVEAHLLGFEGDLYGCTVGLSLVEHLRDERRFDDLQALKRQIHDDVAQATKALE